MADRVFWTYQLSHYCTINLTTALLLSLLDIHQLDLAHNFSAHFIVFGSAFSLTTWGTDCDLVGPLRHSGATDLATSKSGRKERHE